MQCEGPFAGGTLVLQLHPVRIDWVLNVTEDGEAPGFQTLTLEPASEAFFDLGRRWLGLNIPPLQRLAFGAVLMAPVPSHEDGYRFLQRYLHAVKVEPGKMSDLSFQVNRRRETVAGPQGLDINRLSKWSVATRQTFVGIPQLAVGATPLQLVAGAAQSFAGRLELDINTQADYAGPLDPETLGPLFGELTGLAHEIAREGDVP